MIQHKRRNIIRRYYLVIPDSFAGNSDLASATASRDYISYAIEFHITSNQSEWKINSINRKNLLKFFHRFELS